MVRERSKKKMGMVGKTWNINLVNNICKIKYNLYNTIKYTTSLQIYKNSSFDPVLPILLLEIFPV